MSAEHQITGKDLLKRITWYVIIAIVVTAGNVILSGGAIIQSQRLATIERKNDEQDAIVKENAKLIDANKFALGQLTVQIASIGDDVKQIKHAVLRVP